MIANAALPLALAGALAVVVALAAAAATTPPPKGARCEETPSVAEKLERDISECQEEIKLSILKEVLESLDVPASEAAAAVARRRVRRQAITGDDRRIAGCLLQCVYKKVGAVDERGFPLTKGLVQLYSAGAANDEYRAATTSAVQDCQLQSYQRRFQTVAAQPSEAGGQTCELAFDIFECVSERIEQYCLGGA